MLCRTILQVSLGCNMCRTLLQVSSGSCTCPTLLLVCSCGSGCYMCQTYYRPARVAPVARVATGVRQYYRCARLLHLSDTIKGLIGLLLVSGINAIQVILRLINTVITALRYAHETITYLLYKTMTVYVVSISVV